MDSDSEIDERPQEGLPASQQMPPLFKAKEIVKFRKNGDMSYLIRWEERVVTGNCLLRNRPGARILYKIHKIRSYSDPDSTSYVPFGEFIYPIEGDKLYGVVWKDQWLPDTFLATEGWLLHEYWSYRFLNNDRVTVDKEGRIRRIGWRANWPTNSAY